MKKNLFAVLSIVIVLSMLLTATAVFADDGDDYVATVLDADGDGLYTLAADSCDYGGKVLSVEATAADEVVFNLCNPDPAFIAKMAFVIFSVQPSDYLFSDATTSKDILDAPVGTGPYAVVAWNKGDSIIFKKNENYWGEPAIADTLVMKWATEATSRLLEIQSGTADYMKYLGADDFAFVEANDFLQVVPVETPNILYFGMNASFDADSPFANELVRQALAMGIDRQRIVDYYYPEGSEVASHFTPCSIPNGCAGDAWYDYDLDAAMALLAEAGYADGFETTITYRDVYRSYLPEPGAVATDLQAQLAAMGITAEILVMESGEFIATTAKGEMGGIHLLGWGADYPHVTNFLDYHFSAGTDQFGTIPASIGDPIAAGSKMATVEEAADTYAAANNAIRAYVPMIPVVHGATANAASTLMTAVNNPPFGAPKYAYMDNGTDTLVTMKAAEPISLFCADESDGESIEACEQVLEGLYVYNTEGTAVPALATGCTANDDLTVWTCALRDGVTFHDGSAFDANDVVASWAVGADASSPFHVGNTGLFEYYDYLWDGLMNVAE